MPALGRSRRSCWTTTADPGRISAALRVPQGRELVPERAGVVGLDVIHHVALPDVDRAERVVEADPRDGLLAGPALGRRRRRRPPSRRCSTARCVSTYLIVCTGPCPGTSVSTSSARIRSSASIHWSTFEVMSHVWHSLKIVSPVKTARSSGTWTASWPGVWPGVCRQVERVVAHAQRQVAGEDDRALVRVLVVDVAVRDERRRLGVVGRDRPRARRRTGSRSAVGSMKLSYRPWWLTTGTPLNQ